MASWLHTPNYCTFSYGTEFSLVGEWGTVCDVGWSSADAGVCNLAFGIARALGIVTTVDQQLVPSFQTQLVQMETFDWLMA